MLRGGRRGTERMPPQVGAEQNARRFIGRRRTERISYFERSQSACRLALAVGAQHGGGQIFIRKTPPRQERADLSQKNRNRGKSGQIFRKNRSRGKKGNYYTPAAAKTGRSFAKIRRRGKKSNYYTPAAAKTGRSFAKKPQPRQERADLSQKTATEAKRATITKAPQRQKRQVFAKEKPAAPYGAAGGLI